jgi:chromosome segregation ATPase
MPANTYLFLLGAFAAGLIIGLALMWLINRARKARLQTEILRLPLLEEDIKILQDDKIQLHEEIASLKAFRQADEVKLTWLDRAQESMREAFVALAGQSLRSNSEDILKAHKEQLHTLVQPLDKALQEMRQNLRELEGKREGAYGELKENLGQLFQASRQLQMTRPASSAMP